MKKRILFFITSLDGGGAEKVLVNMVNNLDQSKYDITVQTLFDQGINKQYLKKTINYQYCFKKVFRGNIHLFKLFTPKYLYKKFIKEDYDIVVSYFQGATTRIIAGCPKTHVKLVQWIHNEFKDKKQLLNCYRSENEFINLQKRYDATVYVAETSKEAYHRVFPNLITNNHILYNVVEVDRILELSNEFEEKIIKNDEYLNLISVGRLVPQKAFDRLIRIMNRCVNEDKKSVKLFLLGTGHLEKELKDLVCKYKLEDFVIFLGYNTNPYKYVKNADLFVCSSLHEGFSTAVTESLIVGTPVITTECSGMRELLGKKQEYGIITSNNEDDLYVSLSDLINNPFKIDALKEKAIERGKMFSVEERVSKIESFFDQMV